jgi:hypothetical protein
MSICHRADRALGCTIAVWDGDITGEDARKHLVQLASDADWPPGLFHLADLTTIGTVSIPDPELVDLLFEGTTLREDIRIAVVVHSDFVRNNGTRYDASMGTMQAASFGTLAAACAYLGLDCEDVATILDDLRRAP